MSQHAAHVSRPDLPAPIPTQFEYVQVLVHDGVAHVAAHIPKTADGGLLHVGRCGAEVSLPEAKDAGRLAVLQALSWVDKAVGGLDKVERVLRLNVYVAVAGEFDRMSEIADVISRELIGAFGEKARHPRSVLGLSRLPGNSPVMLDLTLAVAA